MKEFNTKLQEADTVEIVAQAAVKKEIKLIGSQRKIPGHILFEYDTKNKTMQPAQYKKQDLVLDKLGQPVKISHKVNINEGCIYTQALNKKNAIKRFNREFGINLTLSA